MKPFFSILLITLINLSLAAQTFHPARLDSLFDVLEKNQKGMGSISLFHKGQEVYSRSYGYTDLNKQIKANAQSCYRIGSITKTFTATVIMQLVESGKLSLNQPLSTWYPQVTNADKITVEHLLRHRSGIYNLTDEANYLEWNTRAFTPDALIAKIAAFKSDFTPGEKSAYSNSNFILLSCIAEKIEKQPFGTILEQRIFKPCNLTRTRYGGKINTTANEALSYTKKTAWELESETDMSIPLGAGSIVSTPADLNRFLNHLFGGKLVSESSLATMKTIVDGFGIGLLQVPFYTKKAWGHNGAIDGFFAQAFYFPEEQLSLAYTSNAVDYSPNNIAIVMLSEWFGMDYDLPTFETVAIDKSVLTTFSGTYSSKDIPLKLTVFVEKEQLMAQATGQGAFPLEAINATTFKFDPAGIVIEFDAAANKLALKQGGMVMNFVRE